MSEADEPPTCIRCGVEYWPGGWPYDDAYCEECVSEDTPDDHPADSKAR